MSDDDAFTRPVHGGNSADDFRMQLGFKPNTHNDNISPATAAAAKLHRHKVFTPFEMFIELGTVRSLGSLIKARLTQS